MHAEPESTAARLVGELLDEGQAVDDGQFSIDPAAAAAKLAAYKYADPNLWLLPIVEGLVGLGATAISIHARRTGLRLSAVSASASATELAELYSHAIGRGVDPRSRALGRLAIGIDMSFAAQTTCVRLRCADHISEFRQRMAPKLSTHAPGSSALELSFERPWWIRSVGRELALGQLRDAVQRCPVEVRIRDELISKRVWDSHDLVRGDGSGFRFSAAFELSGTRESVIELCSNGVLIERLAGPGRAYRAVIELDAPRRDLSQMKLVRDRVLVQALAEVEQARHAALARLRQADASWTDATRPRDWPPDRVDLVLERPVRDLGARRPQQPVRAPLSHAQLRQQMKTCGPQSLASLASLLAKVGGVVALSLAAWSWTRGSHGAWFAGAAVVSFAIAEQRRRLAERGIDRLIRAHGYGLRTHARVERVSTPAFGGIGSVGWKFEDAAGVTHAGKSTHSFADGAAELGETIVIFYVPDDPETSVWEADSGPR